MDLVEPTIKEAIEKAIIQAGGRANLKTIYQTVQRLKKLDSKTPLESIRSDLYRGRDAGLFVQNRDGTYSLPSGKAKVYRMGMESAIYEGVRADLAKKFLERTGRNCHLEITARGFSDTLKEQVPHDREIVFAFLERRKAFPDITGFVGGGSTGITPIDPRFITVEIKRKEVELDDVYQARKYADLFGAEWFGFLISDVRLPEELKRLHRVGKIFGRTTFGYYDPHKNSVEKDSWFPENPFRMGS